MTTPKTIADELAEALEDTNKLLQEACGDKWNGFIARNNAALTKYREAK